MKKKLKDINLEDIEKTVVAVFNSRVNTSDRKIKFNMWCTEKEAISFMEYYNKAFKEEAEKYIAGVDPYEGSKPLNGFNDRLHRSSGTGGLKIE